MNISGPAFGDWVPDLTQERLRQVFGAQTALRGWDDAFRERVQAITVQEDLDRSLVARVAGDDPADPGPFTTMVSVHRVPGGWSVASECSCEDGYLCKHAAGVIFTAQRAASSAGQARFGATPTWERTLREALRAESPEPAAAAPEPAPRQDTTALAVMLEVTDGAVRARSVGPGRSKRWVQSGYSLDQIEAGTGDLAQARAVLAVFAPVLHTKVARGWADLEQLGPGLWDRLDGARRAGVEIVGASGRPAEWATDPLTVHLTLPSTSGGLALQPTTVPAADVVVGDELAVRAGTSAGLTVHPLAPVSGMRLAPLTATPVVVPEDQIAQFTGEYLPLLRRHVEVGEPDRSRDEALPPTLVLDLTFGAGHILEMVWSVVYRTEGGREARHYLHSGVDAFGRDTAAEQALTNRVLAVPGFTETTAAVLETRTAVALRDEATLSGIAAAQFVEQVLPGVEALPDVEVVRHGPVPDYHLAADDPVVELATTDTADADWFDLDVAVRVEGEAVPLPQLFTAIAKGERFIILDNGVYFAVDRPELAQLRDLIGEAQSLQAKGSGTLRLSALQAGLWEELVDLGVVREQSDRWRRAAGALLDAHERDPAPVPAGIHATLREYQKEGYQWLCLLWGLRLGGILADDMGLGKTLQVLALAQHAKETQDLDHPLLVVAPTSVLGTWMSEARKFAPDLRVVMVGQSARRRGESLRDTVADADVVVTSYPLLRIDAAEYHEVAWSGMVLDEAQFVKNHESKTYQVARRVDAPFKVAVTGTPLENSLMDLWSLLSIVAPGLYPNPEQFTETFRRPIEQDRDAAKMATLRRRTRPLMLRRTKEEVARELPPKVEQTLTVTMNEEQRRVYDKHLAHERGVVLGLMGNLGRNRIEVLAALTRLRQLALAPSLVDEEYAGVASAKIDLLVEHLHEVVGQGHRALVFSQFTGFLRLIRDRLEAEGIAYEYLDGSTRDRSRRIDRFKEGEAPVFLISLKAGGFGLNLTEAGYVYVMDPWWNPAAEEQAVDRTHRIGQDKTVMVYRMVSERTIEEKVVALQERKRELFRDVVDDSALTAGALTADDIRGLLTDD